MVIFLTGSGHIRTYHGEKILKKKKILISGPFFLSSNVFSSFSGNFAIFIMSAKLREVKKNNNSGKKSKYFFVDRYVIVFSLFISSNQMAVWAFTHFFIRFLGLWNFSSPRALGYKLGAGAWELKQRNIFWIFCNEISVV